MIESEVIYQIEAGPAVNSTETRYYVTFCDGSKRTVIAANEDVAAYMCSRFISKPCPVD